MMNRHKSVPTFHSNFVLRSEEKEKKIIIKDTLTKQL